jgi:hypothetical protein
MCNLLRTNYRLNAISHIFQKKVFHIHAITNISPLWDETWIIIISMLQTFCPYGTEVPLSHGLFERRLRNSHRLRNRLINENHFDPDTQVCKTSWRCSTFLLK